MTYDNDERQPLLVGQAPPGAPAATTVQKAPPTSLGPLELERKTRWTILAGVWVATFLSSLNMTLVATLLSSISSEFNSSHQASWLGTAYLLSTCTFTPLYGRLCNVLGRRNANQLAAIFTAVGTLGCGLSTNMWMLIAARFVAGIGGGGLFTTGSIITSDMYSMRDRSMASGIASVFNGLGMGMGGPLGGWVNDHLGWRWAFLLQLPFYAVSIFLTSIALRYKTPGKGKSTREILGRIDWVGSGLLLVSVGSFLAFLSLHYNTLLPLSNRLVIASIITTFVSFTLFILYEVVVATEPVLAPFLLRQKVPVLVGWSNFLVALCNFSVMYFLPMWFITVAGTSASTAGLHLFPNAFAMSLGSLFAGYMMQKTGKYKALNVIFGVFPSIAAFYIANLTASSSPVAQWLTIIPFGFGNAVVLQTTLIALLASIPQSHVAVGTGFTVLFRGIGQVSGVGISSAIFQGLLSRELHERITGPGSDELIQRIRHSANLVSSLPPDIQAHARESYAIALRAVFYFATACTFTAILVRIPIQELSLDKHEEPPKHDGATRESREDLENAIADEERDITDDLRPNGTTKRRLSTYESDDGRDPEEDEN